MIKFKNTTNIKKTNFKWVALIVIWTFILSMAVSVFSSVFISDVGLITAATILLTLIATGIIFDIVGTAIAAAVETPFHSMAARRVKAAKNAIFLIRNAEKVANFCNDVVGDIVSISSGGAAVVIITKITDGAPFLSGVVFPLVFTALIAAITVGSKAVGKTFAICNANSIVYFVAIIVSVFKK